ncbi:hypothetical protein WME76_00680 [Sorangium sp. So ce119]|uniref:hypothetical protein n=1 Tax=Sorangium sp. So ce119 TaxID=3133279 RepID=UPI003F5FDAB2
MRHRFDAAVSIERLCRGRARKAAHGRTPELDSRTRRWLRRRCLLTAEDGLRVPVLGAWIREEFDE